MVYTVRKVGWPSVIASGVLRQVVSILKTWMTAKEATHLNTQLCSPNVSEMIHSHRLPFLVYLRLSSHPRGAKVFNQSYCNAHLLSIGVIENSQ